MRRRPRSRRVSRPSARAGRASPIGMAASAFNQSRRSVFMDGFQPAADGPHSFLAQRAFERRHVDAAVAHSALADALQEDLVAFVGERQVAQVGRDTAGDGSQAMAAGTVLIEGGISDTDRCLILTVRIAGLPVGTEVLEAGSIDRLRHDVAVGKILRGGSSEGEGCGERDGREWKFHVVSFWYKRLRLGHSPFCKACARLVFKLEFILSAP